VVHVRPRGFERCEAIFGASFAGLFLALEAPCGVASTASSVEDETRNGDRNENRNPNRSHETIVLGLFSLENLKRAIKQ